MVFFFSKNDRLSTVFLDERKSTRMRKRKEHFSERSMPGCRAKPRLLAIRSNGKWLEIPLVGWQCRMRSFCPLQIDIPKWPLRFVVTLGDFQNAWSRCYGIRTDIDGKKIVKSKSRVPCYWFWIIKYKLRGRSQALYLH